MKVREVVAFVTQYGGIAYATNQAYAFVRQAQERIAGFPDSPAKASLNAFADFVVEREK